MGAEQSREGGSVLPKCDNNEWIDRLTFCGGGLPESAKVRVDHGTKGYSSKESSSPRPFGGLGLGGFDHSAATQGDDVEIVARDLRKLQQDKRDTKLLLDTQLLCASMSDRERAQLIKVLSNEEREQLKVMMIDFAREYQSSSYSVSSSWMDDFKGEGMNPDQRRNVETFADVDLTFFLNTIRRQETVRFSATDSKLRKAGSFREGSTTGLVPASPRGEGGSAPRASPRGDGGSSTPKSRASPAPRAASGY
eukprot:CAMPEP_0172044416 /NCGR_PEP_ID=MMETSP1041-20130122/26781_1 /TAXON_ID=464988 /ORGANISM="Hemiselmis andersenii, Strain CCMP439" /LENGTH=250 /DNA_ID=CAMNT_0012702901 /DNA_START=181 /DNA_END=930 /DNA_ORIENTATION=-